MVAAAGERQEDFDALLSGVRNQFPAQDFLIAFLAGDLAKTIWGLQRLDVYQTAEIRKQCNTARYRRSLEKLAEVDTLKAQFIRDHSVLFAGAPLPADRVALSVSLEKTRIQLEQTSMGIEFLLEEIEGIQKEIERDGYLPRPTLELLANVCGVGDAHIKWVTWANGLAATEMEKFNTAEEADKTTFEKYKRLLSDLLKSKLDTMRVMKEVVNNLESVEERDYLASLVMPPMEVVEKIGRTDARLRRNFHKTLDTLMDFVYGKDR
ncbi:MAG TPA: hypothetical protein VK208_11105 [Pyrinomonadaceae bacterium]|nr:hypothetical protein [Pyrinomonadaceae bacterium]